MISRCWSILYFLFPKRLAGSDPTIGGKDPNADHNNTPNNADNELSRDCCQKQQGLERKSVSDFCDSSIVILLVHFHT